MIVMKIRLIKHGVSMFAFEGKGTGTGVKLTYQTIYGSCRNNRFDLESEWKEKAEENSVIKEDRRAKKSGK